MKKKAFSLTIALALILVFSLAAFSQIQSDNYRIPASVLSGGGESMTSANYQMDATFGQSSAIGQSSSSSYTNYAGFWQPTILKIRGKAMPWIPLLLLED